MCVGMAAETHPIAKSALLICSELEKVLGHQGLSTLENYKNLIGLIFVLSRIECLAQYYSTNKTQCWNPWHQ